MPRGGARPNSGGYRPGSGAKPIAEQVCRIKDINRCWDIVMEFLESDAPLAQRAEMASKFAVKAVPQDFTFKGTSKTEIVIRFEAEEVTNRMNNYSTVN